MKWEPCDGCKTVHPGNRCDERVRRSQAIYLPQWLDDMLRDAVHYGERSAYVATLIARDLGVER